MAIGLWLMAMQNQVMNRYWTHHRSLSTTSLQGDLTDLIPLGQLAELGKLNDALITMQTHFKAMMAEIAESAKTGGRECPCVKRRDGRDPQGNQPSNQTR